ncbi:MAG: hypothetical protein R6U11_02440 [Bacteroidales bacterium]
MGIIYKNYDLFVNDILNIQFSIGKVKRLIAEEPNTIDVIVNTHPEYDFRKEIDGLLINKIDAGAYNQHLRQLTNNLYDEIKENIELNLKKNDRNKYLQDIKNTLSILYSDIVVDDEASMYLNKRIKIEDRIIQQYKERISRIYKFQKVTLKEILSYVQNLVPTNTLKKEINDNGKIDINEKSSIIDDVDTLLSFEWKHHNKFEEDMINLHGKCIKHNLISNSVDFVSFSKAFNGEKITEKLEIPWVVTGKNNLISKRSLIYFITSLREKGLISNPNGDKNTELANLITYIFVDTRGNPLKNLQESISSISQSNPEKSEIIDKIISSFY